VNTSDPSLPVELLAGPYGFLVVIFLCIFWGLREWRKGREQDVSNYRRRAEEAESKFEAEDTKNDRQTAVFTSQIGKLQEDIRALRTEHFKDLEKVTAKYYRARQMLISMGMNEEEIP